MIGVEVESIAPDIDEEAVAEGLAPLSAVAAVAEAKVRAIEPTLRPVLAADTLVVLDGQPLGKPRDREHAADMLRSMSGQPIEVVSAVVVRHLDGTPVGKVASSTLQVRALRDDEIAAYLATGAGDDKAGALEVQGAAKDFVELVSGTRSNVYGLPLAETLELLEGAGLQPTRPDALM